ncbi:MAG: alpha-amylase family glycosyl hydrolase [Sphaerimonospora mesophila]
MINKSKTSNRLYEINTATYLRALSDRHSQTITLATIPGEELARIAASGFDAVWLMGIWQRSRVAIELALANQPLLDEARELLPDFRTNSDIIGSAYSIKSYTVNQQFGGEPELLALRQRLAEHGLGLILDFVPNHTGFDHDWITLHPEYYIQGNQEQLTAHPERYRQVGELIIANGRDPKLGSWSDVAQLNAFAASYRQASIEMLDYIATLCDGVRCDMAMLLTNDIFAGTWGDSAGIIPETEYWQEVITAVRRSHGDFVFIAECYWKTTKLLLDQGFDYCYDKDFYDLLTKGSAAVVVKHLTDNIDVLARQVYFLENHDEPRAAATFPLEKHKAIAYLVNSLPGLLLIYDGQLTGYSARIPVHLARQPDVLPNQELAGYYNLLLGTLPHPTLQWQLLGNSNQVLIGCSDDNTTRVLINYSDHPTEASVDGAVVSLEPWQVMIVTS